MDDVQCPKSFMDEWRYGDMEIKDTISLQNTNMSRNQINMDNRFRYEILTERHVDQVVNVFTYAFCDSEPMTAYLDMDYDRYKTFARVVTENAVKDGFSIVALDADKVIACGLVEDLANPPDIPTDFDPNFKYILTLLDGLGSHFFKDKKFKNNLISHLFITAVHQDYRHRGISTQINFRAMDLAAQHGFQFMYAELTNFYNELGIIRHLKNNKRLIGSAIYKDFVCEGIKPFEFLNGGANSYLWEIVPKAKLVYFIDNEMYTESL